MVLTIGVDALCLLKTAAFCDDKYYSDKANHDPFSTGHAFRKTTAGAFGPDLAKKLSQLVKMEKNVMRSMELVGRERMEVAVSVC